MVVDEVVEEADVDKSARTSGVLLADVEGA